LEHGQVIEVLGIAGSGTIACGLAAIATEHVDVLLWARSDVSARRARAAVDRACARAADRGVDPDRVRIVRKVEELVQASYLVEAIVEDRGSKSALLTELAQLSYQAGTDSILATTTSSLSVGQLARACGHPQRFAGLHFFNPVPLMELVEVIFPEEATLAVRRRTRELCESLGKTPIEVPDSPGFVVNRLLFPYLFNAVELLASTQLAPGAIDRCMALGANMPMGPIALLDYVGLDVAKAIGESMNLMVPDRLKELVEAGDLGRKSGRGFYSYKSSHD
jgi:3-hydroxybutyryl-CoA dehydrogenase